MKIVTAEEMREIDRLSSERYGVPSLTLMENAGTQVAEFVLQSYPSVRRIGVVCGKGNNGGDGFVAARKLLRAEREVRGPLARGAFGVAWRCGGDVRQAAGGSRDCA